MNSNYNDYITNYYKYTKNKYSNGKSNEHIIDIEKIKKDNFTRKHFNGLSFDTVLDLLKEYYPEEFI